MMRMVARLRNEMGAALVEYALVAALIALVSFIAVGQVGHRINHALAPAAETVEVPTPGADILGATFSGSETNQYVLAESPAGTITFVARDGAVIIDSYHLDGWWQGEWEPSEDGVVVELRSQNSDHRIRVSSKLEAGRLLASVYEYHES